MPFAYAGTRRRRNRDRRRTNEAQDTHAPEQNARADSPLARNEGNPERRESSDIDRDRPKADPRRSDVERGPGGTGLDSQDLHDPGSRDPDAPPVDNRS